MILARRIPLPPDTVFAALVDVGSQGRWILATQVRPAPDTPAPVPQPGSGLLARTGVGPFGVVDTMQVLCYEPPRRWRVEHTGSVVRGWGEWGVLPDGVGCRVYWAEEFALPGGVAGRAGWRVVGWLIRAGIRLSLARLDRGLRSGSLIPAADASPSSRIER